MKAVTVDQGTTFSTVGEIVVNSTATGRIIKHIGGADTETIIVTVTEVTIDIMMTGLASLLIDTELVGMIV